MIVLIRFLAWAVLCLPPFAPLHADDEQNGASVDFDKVSIQSAGGKDFSLTLSRQQQHDSGLRTQALQTMSRQPEWSAYGKVLPIGGLLEHRARYRTAQSELRIAEAALNVVQKNRQRLARLHQESIIASKDLMQAESLLATELARTEATRRRIGEVREEAIQQWGPELFHQAVEHEAPLFRQLLERKQVLLRISLPSERRLPDSTQRIRISPAGDRQQAQDAKRISPAPLTDETTQGETWFFITDSTRLRTGMRLDAWIEQGDGPMSGVILPLNAIVWRDGHPWAYVRRGPESFSRRPIGEHHELKQAWFVTQGFSAADEVVIAGAQMLLSEELRRQIPEENEDDH